MTGPRVAVLGGGFAGLETAFMLRHEMGEAVDITLVSDADTFLFKPNTIYLPFGGAEKPLRIPLAKPLRRQDITYVPGRVEGIDADAGTAQLDGGRTLAYDRAVIATGATMRPDEVEGLSAHAYTIWTPAEMHRLGARLERLADDVRRGARQKVLFLVPPGNKCAGPLYEIVFMLDVWLRRRGLRDRVEITWATFEQSYIQAFGPRLHEFVSAEFAARGIEGHTNAVVEKITEDDVLFASNGTHLGPQQYDVLISFPPYAAAVEYSGLPADERGFLRTDLGTRRVIGHENLYAPGDAGDFPVKQAFLAFLQSDAAARDIAATTTGRTLEEPFDPVSMCVMEMFDKATFAQVPLELTGDPAAPVRVRPGAEADYRLGSMPVWRLGKMTLGLYLPWRFRAGKPFHAGTPWQAMEVGLKAGSRLLAD